MLQPDRARPQEPRRLHPRGRQAADRGDPRAGGRARGAAGAAPLRDRVRRRRGRDPLHARAADERRRHRRRVAGDARPRGVLQRHQAHAQRAPGQPAGPDARAVAGLREVQRDERRGAQRGLGRGDHPRPPAGGRPPARAGEGGPLDLALPHRPLDPQPDRDRAARPPAPRLRRQRLPPAGLRAGGPRTATRTSTSSRRRSTRCRRRTWPSRPRTRPTSATSSASTSTGRCSARCRASTPGRTRWA